jgi:hypothetical protein
VLLPVFCLLRRAYSVDVIGAVLVAAVGVAGCRSIGRRLGVAVTTVREWLRRFRGRAEGVRVFFTGLAVSTGVDVLVPGPAGSVVADAVAALGVLWTAVRQRFASGLGAGPGVGLLVGSVTGWQVGCSVSGGRLLSPRWPLVGAGGGRNTSSPLTPGLVVG